MRIKRPQVSARAALQDQRVQSRPKYQPRSMGGQGNFGSGYVSVPRSGRVPGAVHHRQALTQVDITNTAGDADQSQTLTLSADQTKTRGKAVKMLAIELKASGDLPTGYASLPELVDAAFQSLVVTVKQGGQSIHEIYAPLARLTNEDRAGFAGIIVPDPSNYAGTTFELAFTGLPLANASETWSINGSIVNLFDDPDASELEAIRAANDHC